MKAVVIPYRDRAAQLATVLPALKFHFDRIIIAEQAPGMPFNRGAIKDGGCQFANLMPDDTVYFHDVDLLAGPRFPGYPPVPPSRVVHLYGHKHCLGGIVGMQLRTYSEIGGFDTDRWSWGGEDTALQSKVAALGIPIDRSRFTLRYQNDDSVRELDGHGAPLRGAAARRLFLDAYAGRNKTGPAPGPGHILIFQAHGARHDPAHNIWHGIFGHQAANLF